MWAMLRKKIDLEDHTPIVDQVNLGCTQRAATIVKESINAKTNLFQRITTSTVDGTSTRKVSLTTVSAWTNCAEVGLVRQVHTLFVRSAQQVVYEFQVREEVEGVRQEVREVKGESKVEESLHFMSACG